ncbi:hypothetical protein AALO_G00074900 [Alosa alosa]|uniref:Uncharacterized protein n=1 Tax=Alosa alosa TaxID=278164 RepID=A0AAV6GXM8_9TELE|nr:hypothetical protein AALO_G00074900 [Alosa alosa]
MGLSSQMSALPEDGHLIRADGAETLLGDKRQSTENQEAGREEPYCFSQRPSKSLFSGSGSKTVQNFWNFLKEALNKTDDPLLRQEHLMKGKLQVQDDLACV